MGTIQMCSISTGTLSTVDKQMLVMDIPYLFANKKAAYSFLDGPMGVQIRDDFGAKTGTVMLAYGENGFRHFTNRVRPIKSPKDIAGLKIRVQENPAHIAMIKSMGRDADADPLRRALHRALAGRRRRAGKPRLSDGVQPPSRGTEVPDA